MVVAHNLCSCLDYTFDTDCWAYGEVPISCNEVGQAYFLLHNRKHVGYWNQQFLLCLFLDVHRGRATWLRMEVRTYMVYLSWTQDVVECSSIHDLSWMSASRLWLQTLYSMNVHVMIQTSCPLMSKKSQAHYPMKWMGTLHELWDFGSLLGQVVTEVFNGASELAE